jgi:replicative DNA helicase
MAPVEAEQLLIGGVLNDPAGLAALDGRVTPDAFYEPSHADIFAAMVETQARGEVMDVVTLSHRLAGSLAFQQLGGRAFMADLYLKANTATPIRQLADVVLDACSRRRGAEFATELLRAVEDPQSDTLAVLPAARAALLDIEQLAAPSSGLVAATDAASEVLEALDAQPRAGRGAGLQTGLSAIDQGLGGLLPGRLVVAAGRPSMGKTMLAGCMAHGAADRNSDAYFLFVSLEMNRAALAARALSRLSYAADPMEAIAYSSMLRRNLGEPERSTLRELSDRIPGNLLIDDRSGSSVTVEDIRRRTLALRRRGPVGAVFVDYLGLIARPPNRGRTDAALIGDMTRALKALAGEAQACVVLMAQLNRKTEDRSDKWPQLADLRDSGEIEQDADAVLFVYRASYYLEREAAAATSEQARLSFEHKHNLCRRDLDVIRAKNRDGSIGSDRLACHLEYDHLADGRGP